MIIYYVFMFSIFSEKRFQFFGSPPEGGDPKPTLKTKTNVLVSNNFLEINQNGLSPKNSLPPKYKYFVVQQFFRCHPPLGEGIQKKPLTTKTYRFYGRVFFNKSIVFEKNVVLLKSFFTCK